jgi:hypothetical protein
VVAGADVEPHKPTEKQAVLEQVAEELAVANTQMVAMVEETHMEAVVLELFTAEQHC